MGFDPSIILAPYGDHWKFMRKLAHRAMNKTAVTEYWESQIEDTCEFLKFILEHPWEHRAGLRLCVIRFIP